MKHKILVLTFVAVCICLAPGLSHAQEFSCRTYSAPRAAAIVRQVYQMVLEREVDDGGLITFSSKLSGGGWCVIQVAQELGISPEYADRFIKNQTPRQAIVLMYRHFLLREPENEQVITHHVNELNGKGWQAKVLDFIKSPEASKRWSHVRGTTGKAQDASPPESPLVAAGCKNLLGRAGDYICQTQKGFEFCENQRKNSNEGITRCQLAGVNSTVDKALVSQGCTRNAVGEYTCLGQKGFDTCDAFKRDNKVKVCKRTVIKIGGNK